MNTSNEMLASTDRHDPPSVGSRILGSGFASLFLGSPVLSLIAAPGGLVWTAALLALAATLFTLSSRWQRPSETSEQIVADTSYQVQ